MITPGQKLHQQNKLANQYRRESQKLGIGSPTRQGWYIKERLNGHSVEYAERVARRTALYWKGNQV